MIKKRVNFKLTWKSTLQLRITKWKLSLNSLKKTNTLDQTKVRFKVKKLHQDKKLKIILEWVSWLEIMILKFKVIIL